MKEVFAVVPAYNEEKHISQLLKKLKKYIPKENLVVVDDGSRDKTYILARKNNVNVLRHIVNMGKGAALKTGCDFAIKQNAKKIIAIDADLQHDPKEIPRFLRILNNNDIVFGYRKLDKKMPLVLRFGNWFINKSIKLLYNIDLKDTQCGYRAFNSEAYKKIRWRALDYSMESEMISNVGKSHLRYKEIPIETIYSDKYKGTTVIDGVKIVFNMLLWRLKKNNNGG